MAAFTAPIATPIPNSATSNVTNPLPSTRDQIRHGALRAAAGPPGGGGARGGVPAAGGAGGDQYGGGNRRHRAEDCRLARRHLTRRVATLSGSARPPRSRRSFMVDRSSSALMVIGGIHPPLVNRLA
jgi:hypothetical protein